MNVITKIYLDTRRLKKNGRFPIKLRVTFNREQRYYPFESRYDQTKEDFTLMYYPPDGIRPKRLKEAYLALAARQIAAEDIIKNLGDAFSFTQFEKVFDKPQVSSKDVFWLFDTLAKKLRANDQISTAVVTECALSSLKKFYTKEKLSLDQIDADFLTKYEKWMVVNGKSNATIGMYSRSLRRIFNQAIKERTIPRELYPFTDYIGKLNLILKFKPSPNP